MGKADETADPFVISLFRHGDNDDLSITVRGQSIRMSDEDGRSLLKLLDSWYYPVGRPSEPMTEWEWSDATTRAQQRAIDGADQIFEDAGLDRDEPGMEEAHRSVQNRFAKNDEAIQAAERGEDDGCPCESCSESWSQERSAKAAQLRTAQDDPPA